MRKSILLTIFVAVALQLTAQRLHITAFAGFSNYQGDLQDKRFTLSQSHAAFGAGVVYELTDKLSARLNVTAGKVSGDDKKNIKNAARNLNFTSPVTDINAGLEYNIINPYEHRLVPYIFAGVSYFTFNPYTTDTLGRKVYLQPLSTEGQGFYQNRKQYKLSQFAIAFGGGLNFSLSENIIVGLETGLRKTNTDYLDDVSATYVDQALLFANRGAKAAELAFRGDELKTGLLYPADGAQRGSAKNKDWYYFSGITLRFRINSNNSGGMKGGGKYKTGCPTNIR